MDTYEAKETIKKLQDAMAKVKASRAAAGKPMDGEVLDWIGDCEAEIDRLSMHLPGKAQTVETTAQAEGRRGIFGSGYSLKGPNEVKNYANLFGKDDGYRWTDRSTSFLNAVMSGRHHPGLIKNAMSETVPSDGGFLVPSETASRIHAVSLENEIVMPRCFVQPMKSNSIVIPAMEIGSHASALLGGFTASYVAEAGTITPANPKARAMELTAKKLVGMIRFSSELGADMIGGENQLISLCGRGLSWYRDRAFLKGTGAGEPLGILKSPALVEVAAEGGQGDATIVYENVIKMMAAMFPGSFKNSVWVAHQSTIPQLLSLTLGIGTAGAMIPVMNESNGEFRMLTRPVIFTEKTETLGEKGDLMLVDFSQYVVGLRSEMRFDLSLHAMFSSDELMARVIERHDGQPLWSEPLTLADGATEVSPFVVLAERK